MAILNHFFIFKTKKADSVIESALINFEIIPMSSVYYNQQGTVLNHYLLMGVLTNLKSH